MSKYNVVTVVHDGLKTRLVLGDIDCAIRMMACIRQVNPLFVIESMTSTSRSPSRSPVEIARMHRLTDAIRALPTNARS